MKKHSTTLQFSFYTLLGALLLYFAVGHADTFIVTTVDDAGEGSLRWAIENAEAAAGADTIAFNIPDNLLADSDSVWVIEPLTAFPVLANGNTVIDGTTQTQNQGDTNSAGPEIVVTGRSAGGRPDGFTIESANNVIRGLTIIEFGGYGIMLSGTAASNNIIAGNYIGVGVDGQYIAGNVFAGIMLTGGASNSLIGGSDSTDANVISGNGTIGIIMSGSDVHSNTLTGNFIGTSADGKNSVGNGWYGIYLEQGANQNVIGPNNTVRYNLRHGIVVSGSATIRNTITKNSISANGGSGIINESGGNGELSPPTLIDYNNATATFSCPSGTVVEIFSDQNDEGANFEGSVIADETGLAIWNGYPSGIYITATARDAQGNTSEFSHPHRIGPYLVTHTGDSGDGSLRRAIEGTNTNVGPDSIRFAIPQSDAGFDGATWTIQPTSPLPFITDDNTTIDGFSQTSLIGATNPVGPEIVLDGSLTGMTASGLVIRSSGNVVQGLAIVHFNDNGIVLTGQYVNDNWIRGNFIGLDAGGEEAAGNGGYGIRIEQKSKNNVIGGENNIDKNYVSGNVEDGISINYSDNNRVEGNFIGTDVTGTKPVGNKSGISIISHSHQNIIGGDSEAKSNVIAGNIEQGIMLSGTGAQNNIVSGNFIGTNKSVSVGLGNGKHGIAAMSGCSGNVFGPANTVMFNNFDGIAIMAPLTIENTITHNSITNNNGLGINLYYGANNDMLAPTDVTVTEAGVTGNTRPNALVEIFSDNAEEGKKFEGEVVAQEDGSFFWAGSPEGPSITATATDSNNTSMFSDPFRILPFIVTNTKESGEGSLREAIIGANNSKRPEAIHFNIPPDDPYYDAERGVWVFRILSALPPLSGGWTTIDGRTQSQNQGDTNPLGPEIVLDGSMAGEYTKGIRITSPGNEIRGICIGNFNANAIVIAGEEADNNVIAGNFIGLEPDGSHAMPNNGWSGIGIMDKADSNLVGGTDPADRNVIGGFKQHGIQIFGESTNHNIVIGNFVGTDPTGLYAIPNNFDGIHIDMQAKHNRIGGTTASERNLVSGNLRSGIRIERVGTDSNLVIGNWTGVTVNGTDSLRNGECGIVLAGGAGHNIIGGLDSGEANLVSANHSSGMQVRDQLTHHNVILGNIIGLDATGTVALGNAHHGIYVYGGAHHNQIGPENVICCSGWMRNTTDWSGITMNHELTNNNVVVGNYIGTDKNGTQGLGNVNHGIYLQGGAYENIISEGNVIAYNGGDGIRIKHNQTLKNTITKNSIYGNHGVGIKLLEGGNLQLTPPIIEHAKRGRIFGTAPPNSTVEIFQGPDDQGKNYLATVVADAEGYFEWLGDAADSIATATATDADGNTSEFSPAIATDVETVDHNVLPTEFDLAQNFPNPFNPSTIIEFDLPKKVHVVLRVFNVRGEQVNELVDRSMPAGRHQVIWRGTDNKGRPLPSGTYFYSISAGEFRDVKKMVYLR